MSASVKKPKPNSKPTKKPSDLLTPSPGPKRGGAVTTTSTGKLIPVKATPTTVSKPPGGRMKFGNHVMSAQEAGAHIDAYWDYNRLVGESDGGKLLSEKEYAALQKKAEEAAKNRLFVFWKCKSTGMECYCVGPDSRCFCGHSYKAHAWYNTETKQVHCRCGGCKCKQFNYIVGRGTWWIKCRCKHDHEDHRSTNGVPKKCSRCECSGFHSHYSCTCGNLWEDHETVFENLKERAAQGKPTQNLADGAASTAAACGGITSFTSLLPGVDRKALEESGMMHSPFPNNLVKKMSAPSHTPRLTARPTGSGSTRAVSAPAGGSLKGGARTTTTLSNKKFSGTGRTLGGSVTKLPTCKGKAAK